MMLLEYLRNQLLTDVDVAAAVGSNVFCTNPPQDVTGEYVVITQISSSAYDAVECNMVDFFESRIQLEAWSYNQGESQNTWKACRSSFKSFPRGYAQDLAVRSIGQNSGPSTDAFKPIDGSDLHIYRTMQDFNVCFSFT